VLWFVGFVAGRNVVAVSRCFGAVVGAVCQFIPHLGPVLGLIGPGLTGGSEGLRRLEHAEQLWYVLILYASS